MKKIFLVFWGFVSFLPAEVIIGPYLQPTANLENSVGIVWVTEEDREEYRVLTYRKQTEKLEQKVSAEKEVMHILTLSSLQPSKQYQYQIYHQDKIIKTGEYKVPSSFPSPKPYREIWWVNKEVQSEIRGVYYEKGSNKKKETRDLKIRVRYYVKLTNLEPGQVYEYQVAGEWYSFKTLQKGKPTKIALIGDPHVSGYPYECQRERKANEKLKEELKKENPDLIVFLGDLLEGRNVTGTSNQEYENFFQRFKDLLSSTMFIPVPGNHDYEFKKLHFPSRRSSLLSLSQFDLWKSWFYLPQNGPKGFEELSYTVQAGDSFWIILLYENRSAQKKWLEEVLKKAAHLSSSFIFLAEHVSTYAAPFLLRTTELATGWNKGKMDLLKLYHSYGVDVEIGGHWHLWLRTYPLLPHPENKYLSGLNFTGEKENYSSPQGTIFLSLPSSLYAAGAPQSPYLPPLSFSPEVGYGTLTITGKRAIFKAYLWSNLKQPPKLVDSFVIDKTSKPGEKKVVIEEKQVEPTSPHRVKISWRVNEKTKGRIKYWRAGEKEKKYFLTPPLGTAEFFKKEHRFVLQFLEPETTYCYQIENIIGEQKTFSQVEEFTTLSSKTSKELYAQLDFGPAFFEPEKGFQRAYLNQFQPSSNYGWEKIEKEDKLIVFCNINRRPPKLAEDTFCYVFNRERAVFCLNLAPGEYEIEIGSGRGNYQGDNFIELQPGDFLWQYPASEGKKKVLTFKKQIKIEAGEKLQVKIGENNPHASPKSSSVINYLKIWQLP